MSRPCFPGTLAFIRISLGVDVTHIFNVVGWQHHQTKSARRVRGAGGKVKVTPIRAMPNMTTTKSKEQRLLPNDPSPAPPGSKKPKIAKEVTSEILDRLWEHYSCYVEEENGETDEIYELVEIVTSSQLGDDVVTSLSALADRSKNCSLQRHHLLPVLTSVAHCILADHEISEYLALQQRHEASGSVAASIRHHFIASLRAFPENAAAWSMASNFSRMAQETSRNKGTINRTLASLYVHAAEKASAVRMGAIAELQRLEEASRDDDAEDGSVMEWIELLLLNQMAGVELMGDDKDEDEEDEEAEAQDDNKSDTGREEVKDEWSPSAVEGTSRFMASMLYSMANEHEIAERQLQYFPHLTHRLHPKLWTAAATGKSNISCETSKEMLAKTKNAARPLFFQNPTGVLAGELYENLCRVFHPKSSYWSESNYSQRGYYSYFMDLPSSPTAAPRNLIEDVVCTHLLPLARQQLDLLPDTSPHDSKTIVGYEWWVHTRHCAANLGHNLHFDTDEALLRQEADITHPAVSSVLYLTGGSDGGGTGGATVVLDQTPDSTTNADMAWLAQPRNNAVMTFPGNFLHGVLPCSGKNMVSCGSSSVTNSKEVPVPDDKAMLQALFDLLKIEDDNESLGAVDDENLHRLSFMVGFWTRRVPDRMKERNLYGPCGPLPSAEEAAWVQAIHKGYPKGTQVTDDLGINTVSVALPMVSPAWEEINGDEHMHLTPLSFPKTIDHRYFVPDAPSCFRESLFERDDEDTEEEEEKDSDTEEEEEKDA